MKTVFVTGGAGYIGSHIAVELFQAGYDVVIFDNLTNSHRWNVDCIEKITGVSPRFIDGDVRDSKVVTRALESSGASSVIHCAGVKAVDESLRDPLFYYDVNVKGTLNVLLAMDVCGVDTLIFSSSATVYGDTDTFFKKNETCLLAPATPYGQTKKIVEQILKDVQRGNSSWRVGILRYFNPIGAHPSSMLGENGKHTPNNLLPYILDVAHGKREYLNIWGNDYSTSDGTCIRDYVHVVDVAKAHLQVMEFLQTHPHALTLNVGTGKGYSVLDIVRTFERVTGVPIPHRFSHRRPGDVPIVIADVQKAWNVLKWKAEYGIEHMCLDAWRWSNYLMNTKESI